MACRHLTRMGFVIEERNWRNKVGEIDIIGVKLRALYFFEVKTRRESTQAEFPGRDRIDHKKIERTKNLIESYCLTYPDVIRRARINRILFELIEVVTADSKFKILIKKPRIEVISIF